MLNPWMLLGLLGLAVPIVIHLINRRRLQPQLLSTLRFLDDSDVANVFATVPRDVLQLLLRLLLLTLFIILMARLTLPSGKPSPRALVIVLDNSLSMQRKASASETLFARQQQHITQLVESLGADDLCAFVLAGDRVFVNTGLTRDRATLRQAVAAAWVSDGGDRALLPAVARGLAELQGQRVPDCALLVFSDYQQTTFAPAARDPATPELLARGRVQLLLVGEDLPPVANLAVEAAAFHPGSVYLGGGSKLTASVRNLAAAERTVEVALDAGAGQGETRSLTLGAGDVAHLDLAQSFETPVDVACGARISSDEFPADDTFRAPMRMRKRRQILLVAPPSYAAAEGLETGYNGVDVLACAINPEEALGLASGVHTAVKRVTPNGLGRMSLSIYSTVIMYGVAELPEAQSAADLRAYVQNGGGLWLIPDREVNPVQFNGAFGGLLAGLELGVLQEPPKAQFPAKDEAALGDPLLVPLLREEWGNPDEIAVSRYFALQKTGKTACALAARNGDWLAATARLGRGRVCLQTFSGDVADTGFPRSAAFLPMVRTILDYLAGGTEDLVPDMVRAGETVYLQLPQYQGLGGNITVRGPAEFQFPLTEDGQNVRIHDVFRAGNYEVSHPDKKTGRVHWLAVNPVAGESDLTPATAADLAGAFGASHVKRVAFTGLAGEFSRRQEAWAWLLVLALAALTVEALAGAWQARRREVPRE